MDSIKGFIRAVDRVMDQGHIITDIKIERAGEHLLACAIDKDSESPIVALYVDKDLNPDALRPALMAGLAALRIVGDGLRSISEGLVKGMRENTKEIVERLSHEAKKPTSQTDQR